MITVFTKYLNVGARVEIFSSGGPVLLVDNSDGNQTKLVWTVNKTNTSTPDNAVVQIYNLSKANIGLLENIQTLIAAFKFQCRVSFGWDGQVSEVITGQITKMKTRITTANDIITEVEFAESILSTRSGTYSGIQADEGLFLAAFESIALDLGVVLSNQFKTFLASNPVALSLQTINAIFDDNPTENMNLLVASMGPNINWTIQDGQIYIMKNGFFMDTTPPQILQPSTGLLEFTPQEDGGLAITALGHPGIRPGQQILVFDGLNKPLGGGPLRVESISWAGDTDTNCIMNIVARTFSLTV